MRRVDRDPYLAISADGGLTFGGAIRVDDTGGAIAEQANSAMTIFEENLTTHVYIAWDDERNDIYDDIYLASASMAHPLPDLMVENSDLVALPSNPILNASVAIDATIHNIGEKGASDVTVRFFDGNPGLGNQIGLDQLIPNLERQGTATVGVTWVASTLSTHEIFVVVDQDDMITEINETNNVATMDINVIFFRPLAITQAVLTGRNLENVTINWSLSPDDGNGSKSVTGYKIFRNMTYNPEGLGYSLVATLPNGTTTFTDPGSGEGNPNNYFYRVCARDLNNTTVCSKAQAGKFTRPLTKGLNLLSAPLIQADESIETVLQTVEFDKAWVYDSFAEKWKWYMTFKPYKGELRSINETKGFWVNVTEDCNFTVAGIVPFETTIVLEKGWNLVSFPSFREGYTVADLRLEINATVRVEGFSPSSEPYRLVVMQETDTLEAGYGYWIEIAASSRWFASN